MFYASSMQWYDTGIITSKWMVIVNLLLELEKIKILRSMLFKVAESTVALTLRDTLVFLWNVPVSTIYHDIFPQICYSWILAIKLAFSQLASVPIFSVIYYSLCAVPFSILNLTILSKNIKMQRLINTRGYSVPAVRPSK